VWLVHWCRASDICIPKKFVNMNKYFWEERLSGVSIYKNDQLLTHHSVTLMVDPHLEAPYGFWQHINDIIGKENIHFNTARNNFLEETNFNYSCTPLNTLTRICNAKHSITFYISNTRNKGCYSSYKLL
jgi:hypothetical protein